MTNYVAYYRVSTGKQGQSGLGLEAQRSAVIDYVKDNNIISEYTEMESGKKNKRIELDKAIQKAKDEKATLIIAKLDRLSRNAGFIFQLRDSEVDFVACDLPDMNSLTIGIFATIAQHERELISSRTKSALQELKKKGIKLGKPENLTNYSRVKASEAIKEKAKNDENNKKAIALIKSMREQKKTYQEISDTLNEAGYKSSRGNKFYPATVRQLMVA